MKNKRAQFYIIAAVILIVIIISLVTLRNYITIKKEPVNFYNIADNLNTEGLSLIDYGIYNQEDLDNLMEEFLQLFIAYANTESESFEVIIAYGDSAEGKVARYVKSPSGGIETLDTYLELYDITIIDLGNIGDVDEVTITLEDTGKTYTLPINKVGDNFIFVMTSSSGFEQYVYENF